MATTNEDTLPVPDSMRSWRLSSAVARDDAANLSSIQSKMELKSSEPLPKLGDGEVLIRVSRCTLNPNDLVHSRGTYSVTKDMAYPRPIGFEGSGVVVESKASWYLPQKGARVAFYAAGGGACGEYVVVTAKSAIPLPDSVSLERAACSMVNPLSCVLMVDQAAAKGHKTIVNTAAAGTLGRLIFKYAKKQGMEVICVVRKESQATIMKEMGAKYVLNSETDTFVEDLAAMMKETNCTFCYDAVSGDMPDKLLRAGPAGTVVSIYGGLASDRFTVGNNQLLKGSLEFFLVAPAMAKMWLWEIIGAISKIKAWMAEEEDGIKIQKTYSLEEVPQAFADYGGDNKTAGKFQIVLRPNDK